jgi:hypothetical protein
MSRLTPYGSNQHAVGVSKVGKSKSPTSLAVRMPSPEVAAKVGVQGAIRGARTRRVVRRNALA